MATLIDGGRSCFEAWARQKLMPNGKVFYNCWLGEFDPSMSGITANALLDHVDKMTVNGQNDFINGWERAKAEYLNNKI